MTNQLFTRLHRRLTGNASAEERAPLRDAAAEAAEQELRELWQHSGNYRSAGAPDTERAWLRLRQRMHRERTPVVSLRHRLRPWLAAAAVALVVGAWGLWQFSTPPAAWQTTAGERLALTLPDGTAVRLNENSTLRLGEDFGADHRTVLLEGEGYFEVTKSDAARRFVVVGDGSTVTVLGTAFNFRSYPSEKMCDVEVTEGEVRFACSSAEADLLLTAGKRAQIVAHREVRRLDGQAQNATAWHRGYLQFDQTPLETAVIDLGHFYGQSFAPLPASLGSCTISGRFDRADRATLAEVLRGALGVSVRSDDAGQYVLSGTCAQ